MKHIVGAFFKQMEKSPKTCVGHKNWKLPCFNLKRHWAWLIQTLQCVEIFCKGEFSFFMHLCLPKKCFHVLNPKSLITQIIWLLSLLQIQKCFIHLYLIFEKSSLKNVWIFKLKRNQFRNWFLQDTQAVKIRLEID